MSVLAEVGGNQTRATRVLGIAPSTLWRKLKEYGIDPGELRQ
jgi:DNA-binding protein Fis